MAFADRISEYQARVDATLDFWLPAVETFPINLHEALRYSVFNGGKRVRPLLVYATGETLGVDKHLLDPIAAALELIHTYSLVHDDLPAMDDDDLRRGQPTTHKKYDEATAILVGDALQSLAFCVLTKDAALTAHPELTTKLVACLADAAGARGMVGGQSLDLEAEGQRIAVEALEEIFRRKTGALIRASIIMPAHCAPGILAAEQQNLDRYAQLVGLAFQVKDDILDVEGDPVAMGKPQGSDCRNYKSTYPSLVGMEAAKHRAQELCADAISHLSVVESQSDALIWLSEFIVSRDC
jgi:geranylgeranyl pyrophosphate synthase